MALRDPWRFATDTQDRFPGSRREHVAAGYSQQGAGFGSEALYTPTGGASRHRHYKSRSRALSKATSVRWALDKKVHRFRARTT